ncbi:hypothetical protein Tco_0370599 [Tanacetum coccineum]
MAASVTAISSDSSEESVGTSTARVILSDTIPTAIPATVPVVDPLRSRVAARSSPPSSPTDMTLPIRQILPTPTIGRLASRYPPDHSSSDHFSSDDSSSYSLSDLSLGYSSDTSSCHYIPDSPFDTLATISAGLSRKRCRSSTTSVSIATPVSGALSPVRADLLPPRKRIRGRHRCLYCGTDAVAVREMDVRVEFGIETEAEADKEANAEIQPEGTIEIGVDVAIGMDIPDDSLMPDAIERLGKLEEGMQGIERVRADSLQRRLGYVEDKLGQVHELRAYESQILWRMETFMMRTHDYRP